MAKNNFARYVWLMDLIRRHGHITMEQINDNWSRSSLNENRERQIPERTFFNHKKAIADIFGIRIRYDRSCGYCIENPSDMTGSDLRQWMLRYLALDNLLSESSSLRDRIILEEVPSSQKWLSAVVSAMRDGVTLRMTYRSFNRDTPHTFETAPYCLKMFRQRWYMLGKTDRYGQPRMYALDRIIDLETTGNTFRIPDGFNAAEYFRDFYGASVYDGCKPETVRIKADPHQANYIRTLPLHHSQQESCEDGEVIFTYRMVPTYEFGREMLAMGRHVEVLEPQWLRDEIAEEVIETASKYH